MNLLIGLITAACVGFVVLLNAGCTGRQGPSSAAYPFQFTNMIEDGVPVQYLTMSNGILIRFESTNISVSFDHDAILEADYDENTLALKTMFLRKAGSTNEPERDTTINNDGIPDYRDIPDVTNSQELFYRGEWYKRFREAGHYYIMIDGQMHWMHYNGSRWVEVSTNSYVDGSR